MGRWLAYSHAFNSVYDNSEPFEAYLNKQGLGPALARTGLRRRLEHRIVPHVSAYYFTPQIITNTGVSAFVHRYVGRLRRCPNLRIKRAGTYRFVPSYLFLDRYLTLRYTAQSNIGRAMWTERFIEICPV